jgi:hypothetical protein
MEHLREGLRELSIGDAATQAGAFMPRLKISRRAVAAIFATHFHCLQFPPESQEPTHEELLELWKILKEEIID